MLIRALCLLLLPFVHSFAIPFGQTHQTGDEHIVLLNASHPEVPVLSALLAKISLAESHKDVLHIYNNSAFVGFSARMSSHCLHIVNSTAGISHVERISRVTKADFMTRDDAPWGLERISSAALSVPSVSRSNTVKDIAAAETLNYTYTYASPKLGHGADIYILDTGIYSNHAFFDGRASVQWSIDDQLTDLDGHGTHVAGIASGYPVGVANRAAIIGVKVLDEDNGGWSSDVIGGLNYVVQRHTLRRNSKSSAFAGSVINLSLSAGSPVPAMTSAINAAIDAGIHVVIAAGNDFVSACSSGPSNLGGANGLAITVGSIGADSDSTISTFSNWGSCVDVYAPGEHIVSAWPPLRKLSNGSYDDSDNREIKALDGTSMAAPHVTGLVAYAISGNATLAADPRLMKEWIRTVALRGVVTTREGVADDDYGLLASNGVVLAQEAADREASRSGVIGLEAGYTG